MIAYLYSVTLSIIIVNYNVKKLLEQCLNSVKEATAPFQAEVFVVDNASSDNSVDYLQPLFPSVVFIRNDTNVGFSRGNNQALKLVSGEFVLFLNPDTVLPANVFSKCIAFMKVHSEAGALGVRMLDGSGNFLKESKRGLPTAAASFWKLSGIINLFPRSPFFASYYAGHLDENKTHEVAVLSGAFMLARKAVLDITGGFDERFFMYAEDIDLSYRIVKAGYKNYYFADTTIIHHKGSSTNKDIRYVKQFYKAMSQYVEKHHGRGLFSMILNAGIFFRGSVAALGNFLRMRKNNIT